MKEITPQDRAKALVSRLDRKGGMVSADALALEQMMAQKMQAVSNAQLMECRAKHGPPTVKIQRLYADVSMPTRKAGDAAYDLHASIAGYVPARSTVRAALGLKFEIPDGFFGKIETRSSMAAKGIHVTGGVIDSSYRGEVHVVLNNHTDHDYPFYAGDRIAQMLILPVFAGAIEEVAELTPTERGDKGFGSTGR